MSRFLSLCGYIAGVATTANLLTFVDGGIGNILGSDFGTPANASFDFVVVGGGTAGLTIATRLASDPSISVAVIEAGGFYEIDNGNRSVVPGYANFYTGSDPKNYQPLIDWGFTTTVQPVGFPWHQPFEGGAGNRTVHYARGKTLGGSSARHYMVYHRPTKGALQKWADEVGDQSYAWSNFLPFYQKSCTYTPYNPAFYNSTIYPQDPGVFNPAGGPLHVSFSNYADAFGTWVQRGFTAVGMNVIHGLNAGVLNGSAVRTFAVLIVPFELFLESQDTCLTAQCLPKSGITDSETIKYSTLTIDPRNGYRSSSESSFLQAALQNGTAPTIYKNSLARKIIFDNNTATGVLVTTAGSFGTKSLNFTLSARREVIVSAGAFQSPQLLMVSGIGPKENLQRLGIFVLKHLAGVGQNMWDHVLFGTSRRVNVLTGSASLNSPATAGRLADQFRKNASGPLAAFGAGYYGWEDLPEPYRRSLSRRAISALDSFPSDWPELEWLPISAYLGYQRNRQTEDPRDGFNYATINPGLIAPLSRGNISISSTDMSDPPILNPNWLADPTDQEIAVQSFKRSRQIWSVLAEQGLTVGDVEFPGFNVTTDRDILTHIQNSLMTIYHAAATCKMGKVSDEMAVLDSQARVYGTKHLRVVDASSMPFLPPGHPQATIYALAEKIAADILGPNVPPAGYSMTGYER